MRFAIAMFTALLVPITSIALALLLLCCAPAPAGAADLCTQYQSILVREAQAVYGPDAPVPMFAGQLTQESGCRANVTATDLGRGMAQFMDSTTKQVSGLFPELGAPAPYDPRWSIRALVRYDGWIFKRVKGKDDCQRWGGALKGYNAGPGYVMQAQAASSDPLTWFGLTEFVTTRQSPMNFEYSRTYPRKILFKHQPRFAGWGRVMCASLKET